MLVFSESSTGLKAITLDDEMAITAAGKLLAPTVAHPAHCIVARLLSFTNPPRAVLLCRDSRLRINGCLPQTLTLLKRGDQLQVGTKTLYYSDESKLEVVPFPPAPAGSQPVKCSRCHRPLEAGEPVVYCPVCGLVYMAQKDKVPSCWSFGPCLGCKRDPLAEFSWRPEEIHSCIPWQDRPGRQRSRGESDNERKDQAS